MTSLPTDAADLVCSLEKLTISSQSKNSTHDDPELEVVADWVPPPTAADTAVVQGKPRMVINTFGDNNGRTWFVTSFTPLTSTPSNIGAFLARWPPSRTPETYGQWIAVDRGGFKVEPRTGVPERSVQALRDDFRGLVDRDEVSTLSVDRLAKAHNLLMGKWLIFTSPSTIDALWEKVVNMTCLSLQKGYVKVCTRKLEKTVLKKFTTRQGKVIERMEEDNHLICVYVEDYTDTREVMRIRDALRKDAGVTWRIGFKPDVYTHIGLYQWNKWNMSPTIFRLP
ncbi:translation initiation factor eIF 4e-like domain-containing protein [Coprinopsis sp. MPI-PUGE-AT-0042]|nr:translation initiation factor eIF 4e-like domain-containing protein [Coprinopsis sp. MPI-PUGE-AT-0042]